MGSFFSGLFFLGNSLELWALSIIVTAGVALTLKVVVALAARHLQTLAQKTVNTVDDLLAHMLQETRFFVLLAAGVLAGRQFVVLSESIGSWIDRAIIGLILLQVGFWTSTLIIDLINRYLRLEGKEERDQAASAAALTMLAKLALWSVIIVVGLQNMGFEVTGLVTSMGIAGVAVALAAQTVLGDLFGSLAILFDKPFVAGDFIVIGDFKGTVEQIGIKTTRLRSADGEQLVIGNGDLLASRIRNYKQMQERRGQFSLGVTYDTPRQKVARISEIIRESIEEQEMTRFDRAHFSSFGDSALIFNVVYWMTVPDYRTYMDTLEKINLRLLDRFAEEGIEFAYPTQTVIIDGRP